MRSVRSSAASSHLERCNSLSRFRLLSWLLDFMFLFRCSLVTSWSGLGAALQTSFLLSVHIQHSVVKLKGFS